MDIAARILPDGNLIVTAGNAARREIKERFAEVGYWSVMWEIFEPYACNGMYDPFDAGDGNPFVGLTSAPCIAESLSYEDDGSKVIDGRFWYFADYMIKNDLETLWRTGRVVYTAAPTD